MDDLIGFLIITKVSTLLSWDKVALAVNSQVIR